VRRVLSAGLTPAGALLVALQIVGLWFVFKKAGRPGWAALIPIYNLLVLLEIVDRSAWWLLWLFIPLVNIIVELVICLDLADAFDRGTWFGIGLFIAPWLFLPLLGFGGDEYHPPRLASVGGIEF
jgi:hypothetical protein